MLMTRSLSSKVRGWRHSNQPWTASGRKESARTTLSGCYDPPPRRWRTYRKAINTDCILHFEINHPMAQQISTPESKRNDTKPKRHYIPYINTVIEAMAWILSPKPSSRLRDQLMNTKTPLEESGKSAVVYRINCNDCSANYIEGTGKRLGTRLHEHKCANKRNEGGSQFWMRMVEANHQFDFSKAFAIVECSS